MSCGEEVSVCVRGSAAVAAVPVDTALCSSHLCFFFPVFSQSRLEACQLCLQRGAGKALETSVFHSAPFGTAAVCAGGGVWVPAAPGPSVPPASSPPSRRLRCWQACSTLLLPRGPALLRVLEVVMAGAAGSRIADRHRQSWAWLPRFLVLGSRAQTPR